ncbi:MAG TPA: formylglycine-generating enzyme family protein [Acidimicrobiia bacterium]|nr:formylglycine-generating enzyme family protein [Acidimicrobiia bacterium]
MTTFVELPGGTFLMGDESPLAYPGDGEGPVHEVELSPFTIDAVAVTNERFAEFVDATGYVSEAEQYRWSFVFGGLLPDDFEDTAAVVGAEWWRQVFGADWRHPHGPQSSIDDVMNHPAVHISWNDAQAFCAWSGTRLPTEAEWEYAARAGSTGPFPWGDELEPGGEHRMNVFQGTFPAQNTVEDGYAGTAPVDVYEPNAFGLYNMTGNVWEWCSDWFDPRTYANSPRTNPTGPPRGANKIMRGGSYLCHASYCRRYRVSARMGSEPSSTSGNVGFRVVNA